MNRIFFYIFSLFLLFSAVVEAKDVRKKLQRSERREVESVKNMIKSMPESSKITLKDTTLVSDVGYSYFNLSENQQQYIPNIYTLKIYANISNIKQLIKANDINKSICMLPDEYQLQDSVLINDIEYQYDMLDEFGKSYVTITNLSKLYNAHNQIALLDTISEFCAFLSAIPHMVTSSDFKDIVAARSIYDSFDEEAKDIIPSYLYRKLVVAEQKLSLASNFIETIDNLSFDPSPISIHKLFLANEDYKELGKSVQDIVSEQRNEKLVVMDSLLDIYASSIQYRLDFFEIIDRYNFKVEYKFGQVVFGPTGRQCTAISAITNFLDNNLNCQLSITGYADETGSTKQKSLDVAYERAMSVYGQFLIYGAKKEQLIVKYKLLPSVIEDDGTIDMLYPVDFEIQITETDVIE